MTSQRHDRYIVSVHLHQSTFFILEKQKEVYEIMLLSVSPPLTSKNNKAGRDARFYAKAE
jgi:hypothetical protein